MERHKNTPDKKKYIFFLIPLMPSRPLMPVEGGTNGHEGGIPDIVKILEKKKYIFFFHYIFFIFKIFGEYYYFI